MLNTGLQIGDFHCNFSCQKFFLLTMAIKMVAAWSTELQTNNYMQYILSRKYSVHVDASRLQILKDLPQFDSRKRPRPVSDQLFAFYVVDYGRFNCTVTPL